MLKLIYITFGGLNEKIFGFAPLITAAALALTFGGCKVGGDGTGDGHMHTFASEWSHDGEYHWHASTCGHGDSEMKEPHSYSPSVHSATCTDAGYTLFECACGYSYTQNDVPASGHDITADKTEPTCTEQGKIVYSCAHCNYTRTVVLPAAHKYNLTQGEDIYRCSVCSDEAKATAGLNFSKVWENPFSFFDKGELLGYSVDESPEASGEVVIPYYYDGKEVISIGSGAFKNNAAITSVEIPSPVKTIGVQAFEASSISAIVIPENVEEISTFAFWKCASLKDVSFRGVVKEIYVGAFNHTAFYDDENNWDGGALYADGHLIDGSGTEGEYTVKPDTFTIADNAFEDNDKLEKINFPRGLENLGVMTFSGCTRLVTAVLPEKIDMLQAKCFYGCSSLKSIFLPKALAGIDYGALCGCTALETVGYGGTSQQWAEIPKCNNNDESFVNWDKDTGNYTVVCTDVSLPKES